MAHDIELSGRVLISSLVLEDREHDSREDDFKSMFHHFKMLNYQKEHAQH
jgi:hypothetical protein